VTTAGFGSSDVAALVKKCNSVANTFPAANAAGANAAGMAVKTAWLGITKSKAGISPTDKIARSKWNVGYDVSKGNKPEVIVQFRGAVNLVFFKTKGHIIGAKLLGTRSAIRTRGKKILANKENEASNRGVFGKKQIQVNYNRYNSVRQQAATGQLRTRAGKHALTIGGNLRAYAFHKGTAGKSDVWPACKTAAIKIGPETYGDEFRKAMLKSGFKAGSAVVGALK